MTGVVITVGPTGAVATKDHNPHLPTSPEEIAAEVTASYAAGARVASIHLRDTEGRPTADLTTARRTMDLIREQSPILIQLSSGVAPDAAADDRLALMELQPRMATLSLASMTFNDGEFRNPPEFVRRLAGRMRELDIKPELEVYDSGHIDMALRLVEDGLLNEPLQFGLVLGVRGGIPATVDNLVHMVRMLPPDSVWQAIGIGKANIKLAATAIAMGGNTRTGLEDNLYLHRGQLSPGNAPLITKIATIATELGTTIATVEETEHLLGLNKTTA